MKANPISLPVLFAAVVDKTPNEQESYLRERCVGHPDLLEQALRLLHHDRQAANEHFLSLENEKTDILHSGKRIGAYRLMEVLGQGGTGTVYRAVREDDYTHEVAVKVLSLTCSRRQTRERFLKEREILASLNHANIGSILDGGSTVDGHLYYVMPMVKGCHIDDFCEMHHLTFPERVSLIISVCETISYAHKQEVIHRDLKPGNLLVTEERSVIVVDFGLARFPNGGSAITVTGEVLGTPQYMAPELAIGNGNTATPATDIYSLGCVLYKLLAREGPFQGEHPWRTILRIVQDDPLPPSKINPGIPHDLESVCLKCLRKEPSQRYKSAGDLADDLGRFLEGRPVKARQPTWLDYTLNWTYRRRWKAAVLLLCLTLGLIGGLIYNNAKTRHALILAKHAADDLLSHAVDMANRPNMQRVQVEMLSKTIATYAKLVQPLDDVQTYLNYYNARLELVGAYGRVGANVEMTQETNKLLKELEERIKTHYSIELAILLSQTCTQVAGQHDAMGERSLQISFQKRAISLLSKALEIAPDRDSIRGLLAEQLTGLGMHILQSDTSLDAEKQFLLAKETFKPLYDKYYQDDPQARARYCGILARFWDFYLITHTQKERGVAALEEAAAIDRSLAVDFPTHPVYREATQNTVARWAQALEDRGDWISASEQLTDVVELCAKLRILYPDVPRFCNQLALRRTKLGHLQFALNNLEAAKANFKLGIQGFEDYIQMLPQETGYISLSEVLAECPIEELRRVNKAEEYGRKMTEDYPQSPLVWTNYGRCLIRSGKLIEAQQALERALSLKRDMTEQSQAELYLALALSKMGQKKQALEMLQAANLHSLNNPKVVEAERIRKEIQTILEVK